MDNNVKTMIGITVGFVFLVLLIIVGVVFLTINNDKGEPAAAPTPTVTVTATPTPTETSPSPSESTSINITGTNTFLDSMLEKTWGKVSPNSQETLCLGWNVAPNQHDQFLRSFEHGMGNNIYSLIDMSPSEFEAQLSDFFDEKC